MRGLAALDHTAFYPGVEGQPHDLGQLRVQDQLLPVIRVKQQSGQVWHWLAGALPAVGTSVTGHLDWERRYKLMRTHTALHVLCGVVWRDYGGSGHGGQHGATAGPYGF